MPRVKGKSRLQTGSPGSESCSSTHNPEVGGSNPPPATKFSPALHSGCGKFFCEWRGSSAGQSEGLISPVSWVRIPPPLPKALVIGDKGFCFSHHCICSAVSII